MPLFLKIKILVFVTLLNTSYALAQNLKKNKLNSTSLGYEVAFRILLPYNYEKGKQFPVIYATDGSGIIQKGFKKTVEEFQEKTKKEFVVVFVSHVDIKTGKNRRNKELLCNMNYFNFFTKELIPFINKTYKVSEKAEETMLMGISFGGLNAFFFGKNTDKFGKIAIISPAIHPCPELLEAYKKLNKRPFDVFLSTGTKGDNYEQAQRLKTLFELKGNKLMYNEVPYGHDYQNFKSNFEPMLNYFFNN